MKLKFNDFIKSSFYFSNKGKVPIIIVLMALIYVLVYFTGGSFTSFIHLAYIPVMLSSYFWRVKGGAISAVIAGILFGPLMPLTTSPLAFQSPENWIIRLFIFSLFSISTSFTLNKIDRLNEAIRIKDSISPLTGFYNHNALMNYLNDQMKSKKNFSVLSIKFVNIEGIEKYVNPSLIKEIVLEFTEELETYYSNDNIFSSSHNEIILVCSSKSSFINKIYNIIQSYSTPINLGNYNIQVIIQVGVYNYEGLDEEPIDIYNKARIAREQGETPHSGLYIYDPAFDEKRKEIYEISGSMFDALVNDEFFLKFQPIINLDNNTITGVETLIRWNRGEDKYVSPDVFIKIAEETGLIKDISKFVINKAADQMQLWKDKNFNLSCAINLTALELLDNDFFEELKTLLDNKNLDYSQFEFELTERVFVNKGLYVRELLDKLRKEGFSLSIDDFGTGYNSLVSLNEIPFDILKIDRYFINRLTEKDIQELVRGIIVYAHQIGKTVIAEGVETQRQVGILKELNCDRVQGFYYSKALTADAFEEYYNSYSS